MLDAMGLLLTDYRSVHRERVAGADGDYEIDVTARFNALNMNFLVLVECKHHKSPIKRELIQALHSKVQSAGAHKGALFSTSGFQSGALEFASAHGIATVQVVDGRSTYFTRSFGPPCRAASLDQHTRRCWLAHRRRSPLARIGRAWRVSAGGAWSQRPEAAGELGDEARACQRTDAPLADAIFPANISSCSPPKTLRYGFVQLLSIKKTYDPTGLFFAHHAVGSEEWSADGFTRLARR